MGRFNGNARSDFKVAREVLIGNNGGDGSKKLSSPYG